jgi:hypothetical protein
MPLFSSTRAQFGAQARKDFEVGSALALKASNPSLTTDGTYNILTPAGVLPTYCLMSSGSPDGGGWTLAYNTMFDETWMRDQRGYANGTQDSANAYDMNGFWTNAAPGGAVSGQYNMTASCRAAGAYVNGISKILIMYHAGANTTNGLAWGLYTRSGSVSSQSLRTWFNDNTRDVVWSSGNRTNQSRSSWSTPWGNSLRPWPSGGDLFVDNSDNPGSVSDMVNMASYNLVLNGSIANYGYSSSNWNDSRFTTTFAQGSFYGHTLGGIGVRHNNSGYPATAMAIGVYDYCDGRRNAIYGDGGQAVDVTYSGNTGGTFNTGCLNGSPSSYNTAVKGVSIFVK